MIRLLEGPLYFAGSTRAARAVKHGRPVFWCVLASKPVVNRRGTLLGRCYALCGARLPSPHLAYSHAGTPAFLPVTVPVCNYCQRLVHGEAMQEIRRLVEYIRVPVAGAPHGFLSADPSYRAGRAYVEACYAQRPRPGTWRIAAGSPWGVSAVEPARRTAAWDAARRHLLDGGRGC
jgi:hypothetical protein